MTTGVFNPANGKTYTYKSPFTPLNRITDLCQRDAHASCPLKPEYLVKWRDFDYVIKNCCLCDCHHSDRK
jgi:hypothetical protein